MTVPPLRARREDIDALVDFFLQRFSRELAKPGLRISDAAREELRSYDWPGNIRELENCIERAAILCNRNTIDATDLRLGTARSTGDALAEALDLSGTLEEATARAANVIERLKIGEALQRAGSRAAAAELLGISARTLATKMKDLGIDD